MADENKPIRWFFIATNRGDIVGRPADEAVTSVEALRDRLKNDGYINLDMVMSPKADQIITKTCTKCDAIFDLNEQELALANTGRHNSITCSNETCRGPVELALDESRYKIRYTDMVGTYDTSNVDIYRENISWTSPVEDQETTARVAEELCKTSKAAVFDNDKTSEDSEEAKDTPIIIHVPQ